MTEVNEIYHRSFDPIFQQIQGKEFFQENGYVIFRNIFNQHECLHTRQAMSNYLERHNPGFIMNDPHTWSNLKGAGKYGLSSRGPCFDATLVKNRQNPILANILALLIEIPLKDVIVSHDRFTVYRATQLQKYNIHDGIKYATDRKNIHLDCNPWWHMDYNGSAHEVIEGLESLTYSHSSDNNSNHNTTNNIYSKESKENKVTTDHNSIINIATTSATTTSTTAATTSTITTSTTATTTTTTTYNVIMIPNPQDFIRENNLVTESMGIHLQAVLNFHDNRDDDGGTIIVPGFHRKLKEWAIQHIHLKKSLPWVQFAKKVGVEEADLLAQSVRVSMREGSVLLWDQRMMHGSTPNQQSSQCRYAQFMKAYSRSKSFHPCPSSNKDQLNCNHHNDDDDDDDDKVYCDHDDDKISSPSSSSSSSSLYISLPSSSSSSLSSPYSTSRLIRRSLALKQLLQQESLPVSSSSSSFSSSYEDLMKSNHNNNNSNNSTHNDNCNINDSYNSNNNNNNNNSSNNNTNINNTNNNTGTTNGQCLSAIDTILEAVDMTITTYTSTPIITATITPTNATATPPTTTATITSTIATATNATAVTVYDIVSDLGKSLFGLDVL